MYNPDTNTDRLPGLEPENPRKRAPMDLNKLSDTNFGFKYDPQTTTVSKNRRIRVHSFGPNNQKRPTQNLVNLTSTPVNVGPNSYFPQFSSNSHLRSSGNVFFSKQERFRRILGNLNTYQSYLDYSCLGKQISSTKTTEARMSVSKTKKFSQQGLASGFLGTKLSLPHAHY